MDDVDEHAVLDCFVKRLRLHLAVTKPARAERGHVRPGILALNQDIDVVGQAGTSGQRGDDAAY